ncbi:MAG: hypothetical protein HIU92_01335 [Proteobacteria bacterium]|nr:hypothetical protein [Pseudomonadota bacterium]
MDADFWKTEIFGPAGGIMRVKDLDEAIAITNVLSVFRICKLTGISNSHQLQAGDGFLEERLKNG